MRCRPGALVIAGLTVVGPALASAKYRVGVGEQKAAMFESPAWQSLRLRRVRYLVPWDYAKHPDQRDEVDHYMAHARAARQDVLVTFTAPPRLLHRRRTVLDEEGLSRAERQRLSQGIPGVRRQVPVGEDLLGLERDQPPVPAHVQEPAHGRRLLQRLAHRPARASSASWRPTCSTRAT